jgi:hypothetical protein
MEYIPDLKGSLLQGKYLLRAGENAWKSLAPKGDAKDFPRHEAAAAYDTPRTACCSLNHRRRGR